METGNGIPLRRFGKTDVQISALGSGGHHIGVAKDERTAVELVHAALDGGITFYDCCWEYCRGKAEDWLGKGLKGRRDQAFLMTKVCTHGRDGTLATQMLEQSLRRLQTDHIDLWQIHGVGFANDPDLFIRPGGAAEALVKAKKEGKVRFVGFTGHKDPEVHLDMLRTGFSFDAVQMPLNPFDANFRPFSFEQKVLPVLKERGIAALGMKPICGRAEPVKKGVFTAQEMLRYAMSLPVTTTITGFSDMVITSAPLSVRTSSTRWSTRRSTTASTSSITPGSTRAARAKSVSASPSRAILATGVCTYGRKKDVAMRMLEDSLRRLQTDRLDVWQVHDVIYYNDPELAYQADGVLEALTAAKQQGKVRFVGFGGHKNPSIHLDMFDRGFHFDIVQMPINPFDASFRSFERNVLPVALQKGIAVFSVKSMSGAGESIVRGALTPTEALSYAMSVPGVSTTVSGMNSMEVLDQNLEILRNFTPLAEGQMAALREHGRQFNDGRYELYKTTVKYESDLGRAQHGFPSSMELPA